MDFWKYCRVELSQSYLHEGVLHDIDETSRLVFTLDPLLMVVVARFLRCKIAVFPLPYFIFIGELLSFAYPQSGRGN